MTSVRLAAGVHVVCMVRAVALETARAVALETARAVALETVRAVALERYEQ
jgi:hypothetical protein